jgi:hypothetical protein
MFRKAFRINLILIASILFSYLMSRFFVFKYLPISKLSESQFYLFSLVNAQTYYTPVFILYDILNTLLIGYISYRMSNLRVGFLAMLVYTLSPWSYYLTFSNSLYVILLFYLLSIFALSNYFQKDKLFNLIGFSVVLTIPFYISLTYLFLFPFLIVLLYKRKLVSISMLKKIAMIVFLLLLPLMILTIRNPIALKVGISKQFEIIKNFSFIDPINVFQGLTRNSGVGLVGRVIENKFTYFGRHFLFGTLRHFSPATYFTPQERLLGFSFSPPILIGFIIPFFFGLSGVFKKNLESFYPVIFVFFLMLPSILSFPSPDMSKLFLTFPLFVVTIAVGFYNMLEKGSIYTKLLLILSIFLISFQFLMVLSDIYLREFPRMELLI